MSEGLNQRSILRGVQCVCGQWWPDYVMRGQTAVMECCGSSYQHASMSDHGSMLCLVLDNTGIMTNAECGMSNHGKEPHHDRH